mmetsp:Transcript_56333/g.167560  ORF Transcript_56333/g.167560 Transcript_56333/m.167560 type:complete len:313 (+) Transcript_56333:1284-2222(+)
MAAVGATPVPLLIRPAGHPVRADGQAVKRPRRRGGRGRRPGLLHTPCLLQRAKRALVALRRHHDPSLFARLLLVQVPVVGAPLDAKPAASALPLVRAELVASRSAARWLRWRRSPRCGSGCQGRGPRRAAARLREWTCCADAALFQDLAKGAPAGVGKALEVVRGCVPNAGCATEGLTHVAAHDVAGRQQPSLPRLRGQPQTARACRRQSGGASAAHRGMTATVGLVVFGPLLLPVALSSRAVVGRQCRRAGGTSTLGVAAAPGFLSQMPLYLPTGEVSLTIVRKVLPLRELIGVHHYRQSCHGVSLGSSRW